MFAVFGGITLGLSHLTGPTGQSDKYANSYAKHDVIRGKPVLQEIGQELDIRELNFFFDEVFCDPETEWAKLSGIYQLKQAQPFASGTSFDGRRYVVETLTRDVRKTTRRGGAVVRLEASMTLVESPVPDMLSFALGAARDAASAIGSPSKIPNARK